MAKDMTKTYITKCAIYCSWFERFVKGMHSQIGDDSRPNAAISVEHMKNIMDWVNTDFLEVNEHCDRRFLSQAGLMIMCAFLGSL